MEKQVTSKIYMEMQEIGIFKKHLEKENNKVRVITNDLKTYKKAKKIVCF